MRQSLEVGNNIKNPHGLEVGARFIHANLDAFNLFEGGFDLLYTLCFFAQHIKSI